MRPRSGPYIRTDFQRLHIVDMERSSKRVIVACPVCYEQFSSSCVRRAKSALRKHKWRKHGDLICRVYTEDPADNSTSPTSTFESVPSNKEVEEHPSAEAFNVSSGSAPSPEPPILNDSFLGFDLEADEDLHEILENLVDLSNPFDRRASSALATASPVPVWCHIPEGTVKRIVRRLASSVVDATSFPLDELIREFPECPEGLVAEIHAGFLPPEEEGEED